MHEMSLECGMPRPKRGMTEHDAIPRSRGICFARVLQTITLENREGAGKAGRTKRTRSLASE